MNSKFAVLAATSILTMCTAVFAQAQTAASIKELSKKTNVMPKFTDCRKLGVCDLKSVKTVERKIKVLLPDEHSDYASYMTDFRFVIETEKASNSKLWRRSIFERLHVPKRTSARRHCEQEIRLRT